MDTFFVIFSLRVFRFCQLSQFVLLLSFCVMSVLNFLFIFIISFNFKVEKTMI